MKKLLILPALLLLVACDKPTSEAELSCSFDKEYKTVKPASVIDCSFDSKNAVDVVANIKTYDDKAEVSIDNQTAVFTKVKSEEYEPEYVAIDYKGILPGTDKEAELSLALNTTHNVIVDYQFVFVNEHCGYLCIPTKPEYKGQGDNSKIMYMGKPAHWSAEVPYKK